MHPVVITYLLLCRLFGNLIVPHLTLQRHKLFVGDVLKAGPGDQMSEWRKPWINSPPILAQDALRRAGLAAPLSSSPLETNCPSAWLSLESLMRDRMPPLEDLIIGGQPGPIGTSSGIAIIIGGLFLLYRGLIDYRMPLLIVISAWLAC